MKYQYYKWLITHKTLQRLNNLFWTISLWELTDVMEIRLSLTWLGFKIILKCSQTELSMNSFGVFYLTILITFRNKKNKDKSSINHNNNNSKYLNRRKQNNNSQVKLNTLIRLLLKLVWLNHILKIDYRSINNPNIHSYNNNKCLI